MARSKPASDEAPRAAKPDLLARAFLDILAREGIAPPKLGPSPGFTKLSWLKPVFAGDTVTYSVTLLASRALASRPGRQINTILCTGENQNGEPVVRFESTVLEFV